MKKKKKVRKVKRKIEAGKPEKKTAEVKVREPEKHGKKRFGLGEIGSGKFFLFALIFSLVISSVFLVITGIFLNSVIAFVSIFVLAVVYSAVRGRLKKTTRLTKMETVFPDFISLMASNLRAGMTIDRALLLSSRKEFTPLDKEIMILGKDIATGKEITQAMEDTAKRIGSDKISKTIDLIISGIRAGGNLAVLLEETAGNMRERSFVEKRAASNVLMYVIFIFFAVAFGAPLLFGLSSVLVQVLTELVEQLPTEQVVTNAPFALTSVSISVKFITYFAFFFLIVTAVLASMVLGLVSKGKEREGTRYMLPLVLISVAVFFVSRWILLRYFSGLFS